MADYSTLEDLLGDDRCLARSSDTDLAKDQCMGGQRPAQAGGVLR
jgi:hypothetical protein